MGKPFIIRNQLALNDQSINAVLVILKFWKKTSWNFRREIIHTATKKHTLRIFAIIWHLRTVFWM